MLSLFRIFIVQDDFYSCCIFNVNMDSFIYYRIFFCSICLKYSNDLVFVVGIVLCFFKIVVVKNEEVEMERRQGLQGGKN